MKEYLVRVKGKVEGRYFNCVTTATWEASSKQLALQAVASLSPEYFSWPNCRGEDISEIYSYEVVAEKPV